MFNKWIDDIVLGLIETYGKNIYEIYKSLEIEIITLSQEDPILRGNLAIYARLQDKEVVFVSDMVENKDFVLAHELGHAILHVDEDLFTYNPVRNLGKLEKEADYFATQLLYNDYTVEDGIYTIEELASRLNIKETCASYIANRLTNERCNYEN